MSLVHNTVKELLRKEKVLDDAYEKEEAQRLDDAKESCHTWRRSPGCTMDMYIQVLKRYKTEYLAQDRDSVISGKSFAQRRLTRSGLSHNERMNIYYMAGGSYVSAQIEKVLRRVHSKISDPDAKQGKTYGN